jgi:hypothetical protein
MKRLSIVLPAAAVATVVIALMSTSGSAQTPGTTLQLFESEKGASFRFVDNPPKSKNERASVGDAFAFNSPVLDQARQTRLGNLSAHCTVTRPGKESNAETVCLGAFRLPDGIITLATSIKGSPKTVTAAVTGGTGAYQGARGSLTSTTVEGGSEDTITLLP